MATMNQVAQQVFSGKVFVNLIMLAILVASTLPGGAEAGGMLISDSDPNLAINAWDGAQHGTVLRLHKGCQPTNPDCTWTYRNGMLISDSDPNLAINAWDGVQHGTVLRLHKGCQPTNPDCTWAYRNEAAATDEIVAVQNAVNGCGPEDWRGAFVPDYFFQEACDEHDNCYEYPAKKSREKCDADFFHNLIWACDGQEFPPIPAGINDDWSVRLPMSSQQQRDECYDIANEYYRAVATFGESRYDTVSGASGGSDGGASGRSDSGSSWNPFGPYEPSPWEPFCTSARAKAEADCAEKGAELVDFDCFEGSKVAYHECKDAEDMEDDGTEDMEDRD
jgi:hypothetical protein